MGLREAERIFKVNLSSLYEVQLSGFSFSFLLSFFLSFFIRSSRLMAFYSKERCSRTRSEYIPPPSKEEQIVSRLSRYFHEG